MCISLKVDLFRFNVINQIASLLVYSLYFIRASLLSDSHKQQIKSVNPSNNQVTSGFCSSCVSFACFFSLFDSQYISKLDLNGVFFNQNRTFIPLR